MSGRTRTRTRTYSNRSILKRLRSQTGMNAEPMLLPERNIIFWRFIFIVVEVGSLSYYQSGFFGFFWNSNYCSPVGFNWISKYHWAVNRHCKVRYSTYVVGMSYVVCIDRNLRYWYFSRITKLCRKVRNHKRKRWWWWNLDGFITNRNRNFGVTRRNRRLCHFVRRSITMPNDR